MICQKCKKDFPENELQESHDIPCYIFEGENRKEQKQQADKEGRHWLCLKCHGEYEFEVLKLSMMQIIKHSSLEVKSKCKFIAKKLAQRWFDDRAG